MPARGWTTIALKDDLMAQVDRFIETNRWGFSNRAEVVAAAVREFLQKQSVESALTRADARARARHGEERESSGGKRGT